MKIINEIVSGLEMGKNRLMKALAYMSNGQYTFRNGQLIASTEDLTKTPCGCNELTISHLDQYSPLELVNRHPLQEITEFI